MCEEFEREFQARLQAVSSLSSECLLSLKEVTDGGMAGVFSLLLVEAILLAGGDLRTSTILLCAIFAIFILENALGCDLFLVFETDVSVVRDFAGLRDTLVVATCIDWGVHCAALGKF